ncbi:MAG: 16S rRNA (uracil(1498)-N(3))-methyltransferase [Candidatus Korobacteraceae bacterium]
MTRRRWIADEIAGNHAALTGSHAAHLARVLRARVGQEFEISGADRVRLGRVIAISADRVEFELGEEVAQPAVRPVMLFLSIFRFDRMEWAIEKATELGVTRIVPTAAGRSDAHLVAAAARRVERWRRIALQAAQQSRRAAPPEVHAPQGFQQVLEASAPVRIVLAENERRLSLRNALEDYAASPEGDLALTVGPEGGWTAEELAAFEQHRWQAASLGPGILRAETAAIAALAVCSVFNSIRQSE